MPRIIPTKSESRGPALDLFQIVDVSFGMRWPYHASIFKARPNPSNVE